MANKRGVPLPTPRERAASAPRFNAPCARRYRDFEQITLRVRLGRAFVASGLPGALLYTLLSGA